MALNSSRLPPEVNFNLDTTSVGNIFIAPSGSLLEQFTLAGALLTPTCPGNISAGRVVSVRGKTSSAPILLFCQGLVLWLGKGKTGKKNGRLEMNRIQMKEDNTLRNSRKTSMVVKSSQVKSSQEGPSPSCAPRRSWGLFQPIPLGPMAAQRNTIAMWRKAKTPESVSISYRNHHVLLPHLQKGEHLLPAAPVIMMYNPSPPPKEGVKDTRRTGARIAGEEIKEQIVVLLVFSQAKKTLQTRSLQLSLTFGALQPNTQENWDCQRD